LERIKAELLEDVDQVKGKIVETENQKLLLEARTKKLASNLDDLQGEIDQTEQEKLEQLNKLNRVHKGDVNQIKKKAERDTRQFEIKKRELQDGLEELNLELEEEKSVREELDGVANKLGDEANTLTKMLEEETAEKLEIRAAKKLLEREVDKAHSFLEADRKGKSKSRTEAKEDGKSFKKIGKDKQRSRTRSCWSGTIEKRFRVSIGRATSSYLQKFREEDFRN